MNVALTVPAHTLENRLQRIRGLDLAPIRFMLMQAPPTGFGWSPETALHAERLYRQFLELNLIGAVLRPVPDVLADSFWHAHILDTKKYREDCQSVFGYFLDHNPGFGAYGDAAERDQAFNETMAARITLFCHEEPSRLGATSPSMCGSSEPLPSMCGSSGLLPSMCGSSEPLPSMCGSSVTRDGPDELKS